MILLALAVTRESPIPQVHCSSTSQGAMYPSRPSSLPCHLWCRSHLYSVILVLQPGLRPMFWPFLSCWIAIAPAPPRMWSSGGSREYWGQNKSTLTQQVFIDLLLETKCWTSCKDSRVTKDREGVWPLGVHGLVGLTDIKPPLVQFII